MRPLLARWGTTLVRTAFFLVLLDTVLFGLLRLLPSAVTARLGLFGADAARHRIVENELGLDRPWHEQLVGNWTRLAHGDFGRSYIGQAPVRDLLAERLAVSWSLVGVGMLCIGITVVVLLALLGAPERPKILRLMTGVAAAGAWPQFLSALALFVVFISLPPAWRTDTLRTVMAGLACGLVSAATVMGAGAATIRGLGRATFLDTYRALGLSGSTVRWRLWPNLLGALRPLLARTTLWVCMATTVVEPTFGIRGMGSLLIEAVRANDLPVVRLWMLLVGGVVLMLTSLETPRQVATS